MVGLHRNKPWRPDGRPVFVLAYHGGGGGIERHLCDLAARLLAAGTRPVSLRPGPSGLLLWEERVVPGLAVWKHLSDSTSESIDAVLSLLKPAHAHVHSLMGLPDTLIARFAARGMPYDWTLHDYYPICPRAHLNRADGSYCGEPGPAGCAACLARLGDYRGVKIQVSIEYWRLRHAGLLRGARRVFAPCDDVRQRIERYAPGIPVRVIGHPEAISSVFPDVPQRQAASTFRVAVLGTMTALKGAAVLEACAWDAARRCLPLEFVVFGRTDRDAALRRSSKVRLTGVYRDDQVFARLAAECCQLALLPTLVPETYMYTLSIAVQAGLPAIVFDLGAQAERLRNEGHGLVLPLDTTPEAINQAIMTWAVSDRDSVRHSHAPCAAEYSNILADYYAFTAAQIGQLGLIPDAGAATDQAPRTTRGGVHARVH